MGAALCWGGIAVSSFCVIMGIFNAVIYLQELRSFKRAKIGNVCFFSTLWMSMAFWVLQEHKLNFYNKNNIGDDTKVLFGIWRQG